MRVLSIDQSFTSCGFVILDDEEAHIYTHGVISAERYCTNGSSDIFARAWSIAQHAAQLAQQFDVDFIALEGLAFSKLGNATRDLAGLQFTIISVVRFINEYDVVIVPPNAVKKTATGKGNAKKELLYEVLPEITKKYFLSLGVKKTTGLLDLTDAFWIGKAALLLKKYEKDISGVNRENTENDEYDYRYSINP